MVSQKEWLVIRAGGKNTSAPKTKLEAEQFKIRMESRYPWLKFEIKKI